MLIKCDIEVVTGFLGSGKTSFINALLNISLIEKEKVVVLQCEKGNTAIENKFLKDDRIFLAEYIPDKPLTKGFIIHIIELYKPHRIIIEYNGTRLVNELLDIIYSKELEAICKLTTAFHMAEAKTFELFISNFGGILIPYIEVSNMILVNNLNSISKNQLNNIRTKLNSLNPYAHIVEIGNNSSIKTEILKTKTIDNGILKKLRIGFKNLFIKES